jgi:hypothetical protein
VVRAGGKNAGETAKRNSAVVAAKNGAHKNGAHKNGAAKNGADENGAAEGADESSANAISSTTGVAALDNHPRLQGLRRDLDIRDGIDVSLDNFRDGNPKALILAR